MPTYLGYDVLTIRTNASDTDEVSQIREFSVHDPLIGSRAITVRDTVPKLKIPYKRLCTSKSDIIAAKNWFKALKGRAVPFWFPSSRFDLVVAQTIQSTDVSLSVLSVGYTPNMYPYSSRRHLVFPSTTGDLYRKITSASDNGVTETLGFTGSLGKSFAVGTKLSYLLLCRLASDDLSISYHNDSIAEIALEFIEVPGEAP